MGSTSITASNLSDMVASPTGDKAPTVLFPNNVRVAAIIAAVIRDRADPLVFHTAEAKLSQSPRLDARCRWDIELCYSAVSRVSFPRVREHLPVSASANEAFISAAPRLFSRAGHGLVPSWWWVPAAEHSTVDR